MAKDKQIFYCSECGFEAGKWMGQCPSCKAWNSFTEHKVTGKALRNGWAGERPKAVRISEVTSAEESRIKTDIGELDRVLGGGIVPGSLVLIGGAPGIGKSTLLLEMCRNLTEKNVKTLYISGEESLQQIRMRGERIGISGSELLLLSDNSFENAEEVIRSAEAQVVIVDSIQTMETENLPAAPGTVSQVREITARLMVLANQLKTSIFVVGHVTKEGTVAGPRTLEHMVDSVIYFEGDNTNGFRLLRAEKNRFGSTDEIGVFNMTDHGLEEVVNPSELFLSGRPRGASGSVVVSMEEGTRAVLVELQALCCDSSFNMPRRTAVGVDYNRVNLLIAVLEKRGGISLSGADCYVNIAGGLRVSDPSADLGIICAIASSFRDRAVPEGFVIIGEIGLAGEIRGIRSALRRVKEAVKMGYTDILLPASNRSRELDELTGVRLHYVSSIQEALALI